MPQPSLGSSLQSFSLTRIAFLSRGRWLPCSYPPTCWGAPCFRLVTVAFTDAHAFTQWPGSPQRLWTLFPRTEVRFPAVLGSCSTDSPRSASFTYFGAFFPSRDRSSDFGLPLGSWSFLSWVSSPSKLSPSTPRVLYPPGSRGPGLTPLSEDSGVRLRGPVAPNAG